MKLCEYDYETGTKNYNMLTICIGAGLIATYAGIGWVFGKKTGENYYEVLDYVIGDGLNRVTRFLKNKRGNK